MKHCQPKRNQVCPGDDLLDLFLFHAVTLCKIGTSNLFHCVLFCGCSMKISLWKLNCNVDIVFCFTFFQLQLRETVGKPDWAVILRFPSRKRGVKSRGTLRDPAGVEMGYTPAWDPPFSTRKRKILAKLGFSTVLRNVTGKRWNRKLFLLFSGPE